MHRDLWNLLNSRGFLTRPEIMAAGHDDRVITSNLRAGRIVRIGPGLFAAPSYGRLSPEDRHLLRCRAVATRFGEAVVFSHQSAALLHGAKVWGVDLDHLQVTRADTGRGRSQAGVHHRAAVLADDDVTERHGLLVTTAARTTWDLAASEGVESGLVTADSMLHLGLTDDDELLAQARRNGSWRGARHAKATLSLSNGLSESVGETRSRYLVHEMRLPRPVLQHPVHDADGVIIGYSDLAWPEYRHLGEFDGMIKYGAAADLAKEKWREDRIRAMGWGITRIIWSQLTLGRRRALADELTRAMRESRRLYGALGA